MIILDISLCIEATLRQNSLRRGVLIKLAFIGATIFNSGPASPTDVCAAQTKTKIQNFDTNIICYFIRTRGPLFSENSILKQPLVIWTFGKLGPPLVLPTWLKDAALVFLSRKSDFHPVLILSTSTSNIKGVRHRLICYEFH